jgi:SAM-dependent methyltransferase
MVAFLKKYVPLRMKGIIVDAFGITKIHRFIDLLYEHVRIDLLYELAYGLVDLKLNGGPEEAMAALSERSRARWRASEPNAHLTWGIKLTGDNFIAEVKTYGAFSSDKNVLEIGAGYGRLLASCLRLKMPFKQYVGLDISEENIVYLRREFTEENIAFIQGDVEKVSLDIKFDVVLSSLTFKHLFPSFEKALRNVMNYVNPGGLFFFDLPEGQRRLFSDDGLTYIHEYTRTEVCEILSRLSLQLVAFDKVHHIHQFARLLVIGQKPINRRS